MRAVQGACVARGIAAAPAEASRVRLAPAAPLCHEARPCSAAPRPSRPAEGAVHRELVVAASTRRHGGSARALAVVLDEKDLEAHEPAYDLAEDEAQALPSWACGDSSSLGRTAAQTGATVPRGPRTRPSAARSRRHQRPRPIVGSPEAPAGSAGGWAQDGGLLPELGVTDSCDLEEAGRRDDADFLKMLGKRLDSGKRRSWKRGSRPEWQHAGAANTNAVQVFMAKASPTNALLSREEEYRLSNLVQARRAILERQGELAEELGREPTHDELAEALGRPSLTETDLRAEMALGKAATNTMMRYNLRLVVHVARRHLGRGVDLPDLISEGMEGLERAVERFDPSRGFKFSTYAHWWVRQAVGRCIADQSRVVRLPVHVYDTLRKISRVRQELVAERQSEDEPSVEEIAMEMGTRPERVAMLVRAAREPQSLDTPVDDSGMSRDEATLGESIAVHDVDRHGEESRVQIIREDIDILLATLAPRERNVLRMRYGLARDDGGTMTFNDIGAAYGLTRERIRQIEDKALRKLQHPLRRALLRSHLYNSTGPRSDA
ncbi:unnamed protein product [Pedinophyceae sp. YPF-701]|nr:unnamed protein product [Pedinophyceae sp. YPF-701]